MVRYAVALSEAMPARALHPTTANAKKNYTANALKLDPSPNFSPLTGVNGERL